MRRLLVAALILLVGGAPAVPAGMADCGLRPAIAPASLATPADSPPLTWERQYDNQGKADLAWAVAETPQGDFVVVGATGPTPCVLGCNYDGWVVKIDGQGDVLWTRQVGGNGADLLVSLVVRGDKYIIAGSKYVFLSARQAWLVEMTPDGDVAWQKTLGGSLDDSVAEIIPSSDGNLFAIGATASYGVQDGKSDVWLLKMTPTGDILWDKTYDLGATDGGASITPFQGDKLLVAADTCTADCSGLFQQGFATYLVLDSAGNLLKSRSFPDGPKSKFMKVRPTADGGAILVGATSVAEQFPSEDTWIVKLDASADVSWTRIVRSRGRYDGAFDVVQMPDGGYVVSAYSQAYQTPEMNFDNFTMLRLGSDGYPLWIWMWGGADNDDARAVIRASDGSIVLAGFRDAVSWPLTEIPGPSDFYVVRTTADRVRVFLPSVFKGAQ
ncbi:MAG: lipoprotein [Anaerolineales bacterium]